MITRPPPRRKACRSNRPLFAPPALKSTSNPSAQALLGLLPKNLAQWVSVEESWIEKGVDAVLFDGKDADADTWRQRLAACEGPICPLVRAEPEYDLARLVHERTLSVNTAAAGGNASLMTMGA